MWDTQKAPQKGFYFLTGHPFYSAEDFFFANRMLIKKCDVRVWSEESRVLSGLPYFSTQYSRAFILYTRSLSSFSHTKSCRGQPPSRAAKWGFLGHNFASSERTTYLNLEYNDFEYNRGRYYTPYTFIEWRIEMPPFNMPFIIHNSQLRIRKYYKFICKE